MGPATWLLVDWIGTTTNIRATVVPELERFGKRCRIQADWDHFMDAWGVVQRVALDRVVLGEDPWRPQGPILFDAFKTTLAETGIDQVSPGRPAPLQRPYEAMAGCARRHRPVEADRSRGALQPEPHGIPEDADCGSRARFRPPHQRRTVPVLSASPEGFAGAAKELGVSPEEIVFLSAHPLMLRGAATAGMQVVQIERPMRDTRLVLFEPTADLHLAGRVKDLPRAAEWLAAHLPR